MISISVEADVKKVTKDLSSLAYEQVPFGTAFALTSLAKRIRDAETKALSSVFDRPVPFTLGAFGVISARKSTLEAIVFAKDIQAKYLAPSEFGEPQYLGAGKAIRTPVAVQTDASGNLPKDKIKQLLAQPDVFMAKIGNINGIWQRQPKAKFAGKRVVRAGPAIKAAKPKLLIAFTKPKQIKTHLEYRERAEQIVDTYFTADFAAGMERALATAK